MAALLQALVVSTPTASAVTSTLRLRVQDAVSGDAIPQYQFLVTRDDTGNPGQPRNPDCMPGNGADPATAYPSTCDWPSVHAFTGGAGGADNLVTQGNAADLNETTGVDLAAGRYIVSVVADGHKIGAAYVDLPQDSGAPVVAELQPDPLPLGKVRIQVFEDASTNGQFDPNVEHGLAGFRAHIYDVIGEVSTDWYGNPLCTEYDANHDPIPGSGGQCRSNAAGDIVIPNLGSNRYSVQVVPPDGQPWIQTSTLEGGHDWDVWAEEGHQGYDQEVIVNGAPIAEAQFGYVRPTPLDAAHTGSGRITGRVVSVKSYLPPAGGDTFEGPVSRPWIAVVDLLDNDRLVYAGRGNANGTFSVPSIAPSDYQVTYWDQEQNLLLSLTTTTVRPGQTVNLGDLSLAHWFSELHGSVFIDSDQDGVRDPGEPGLAGQAVVLKSRDNSLVDAGSKVATTDTNGNWRLTQVYPYGYWTVLEAYNDRFYTTGFSYQTDNQPQPTTVLGAGVDIATLNQDGLNSRIDIGVHAYPRGSNGGIVGSVVYNETRNELDPRLAATEDYEPGIPDLTVDLFAPVTNPDGTLAKEPDGSYAPGRQLGTYTTETFERPTDCQARDAGGSPMDLLFAPPASGGFECIESPLMGNQVQTGFSTVNGNYGFGTQWKYDADGNLVTDQNGDPVEEPLANGKYLVVVHIPEDEFGNPKYHVSREEDINVFSGDDYSPQVPPPPCAGALHTVDVAGVGPDGPDATVNPDFADAGGSPYEGQQRPLCDVKLVTVNDQRSVAPSFHLFTDVPQPGRLFGAVVEDLALGTDPKEFYYGEKAGLPNVPVGIYDFAGHLVKTIHTDPNGFFEVLLPSTKTFNCALPAGPCPNVFRLVGNDPGTPAHPNPDFNPAYRTLASSWQIWPGQTLLADVALLPTSPVTEFPGTQSPHPPRCLQPQTRPQFFAVDKPYVRGTDRAVVVHGDHFGSGGQLLLDGNPLPVSSWSDRAIQASVPRSTTPGPHQLSIVRGDNGARAVNVITLHVLGTGYQPALFEVGQGKPYSTVQDALEAAAGRAKALVVVYPAAPGTFTPLGDRYENVVMHSPVKLQGVGPGGVRADESYELGSILNGLGFATTRAQQWSDLVEGLRTGAGWDGNQQVSEGQVVYVLARDGQFKAGFNAAIDGFTIQGGDEFGTEGTFVNPFYPVQGGGIFVNAFARHLQVTNNVIRGNGGAYAGGIRVGTPYVGSNHNDDVRITHNRILNNGGSNLAGGIGLFAGSNGYSVDHNDICGNFSAEYGGAMTHFGLSSRTGPAARISDNTVWANGSYDEGGGLMIAGEDVPAAPNGLSPGSGPVDLTGNVITSNLAEDDGGGLRFLSAGNWVINASNNMITNNVSAHEGGGVALDDTTRLRFYDNTVMKNVTTSTAATSDGEPVPAGLATGANSAQLQASLPAGSPVFSRPLLFNNIFWDNRAGRWDRANARLTGLGFPGDPTPVNVWDMGALDQSGRLTPTYSVLTENDPAYVVASPTNRVGADPAVAAAYDTIVRALPWRGDPNTTFSVIVSLDQPPELTGDYHLASPSGSSPAHNTATDAKGGVSRPATDIDGDPRPAGSADIGADEDPGSP